MVSGDGEGDGELLLLLEGPPAVGQGHGSNGIQVGEAALAAIFVIVARGRGGMGGGAAEDGVLGQVRAGVRILKIILTDIPGFFLKKGSQQTIFISHFLACTGSLPLLLGDGAEQSTSGATKSPVK